MSPYDVPDHFTAQQRAFLHAALHTRRHLFLRATTGARKITTLVSAAHTLSTDGVHFAHNKHAVIDLAPRWRLTGPAVSEQPERLVEIGQVLHRLLSLLVSPMTQGQDILLERAAVRADLPVRDVPTAQQLDQMGPRDPQQVGSLLSAQLCPDRKHLNRVSPGEFCEDAPHQTLNRAGQFREADIRLTLPESVQCLASLGLLYGGGELERRCHPGVRIAPSPGTYEINETPGRGPQQPLDAEPRLAAAHPEVPLLGLQRTTLNTMDRDPELRAIDDEYVEAVSEALRLGTRPARTEQAVPVAGVFQRLRQPELRVKSERP